MRPDGRDSVGRRHDIRVGEQDAAEVVREVIITYKPGFFRKAEHRRVRLIDLSMTGAQVRRCEQVKKKKKRYDIGIAFLEVKDSDRKVLAMLMDLRAVRGLSEG